MEFDFTTLIDRSGTGSTAAEIIPIRGAEVREGFDKIPMWVADMSFATVPAVQKALHRRIDHPCFGYFITPDAYYDAIIDWQRKRNGVEVKKEQINYQNGVLGGVVSALQAFTAPGESILVHAPTYVGFTGVLTNNGRNIVHSQLKQDEQGVWRMDYEDMEAKFRDQHIHFMVFCSPHNPCGRVWERWELEKAYELFKKYDVIVVSDEIWSDIILPGHTHIPTASISDDARSRTISLYALSKTFNLAGLVGSYSVIYNDYLRDRVMKQAGLCHYNDANVLSVEALIGAYCDEGERWVGELCETLNNNVELAYRFFTEQVKGVKLAKPEGTYMMYLDCEDWCREHGKTIDELQRLGVSVGVIWQDGRPFHRPYAIRLNLALPTARLQEALDRLDKYVFNA
ncbi:MAG: aminotransferase class I/II-fold pyridoxal phosphate-dependent enzyme [Clostridiales bacterium]|nr:aminotransferase class I/II-fold pyridoxal phosphate-dependent enzyme [Candidatus Apopatocola equi]